MKILMLSSATVHSTLTHRILSLGRELVRRGHQVSIIAPRADKYSGFQSDMPGQVDGIHMIYPAQLRTRNFILNLLPYILSAAWQVIRHQADVVYLYKPTPVTISGLLAKWLKRTPVVLDMDDLGSEVMRAEKQPALICTLVEFCERLAAHQANAIIAASTLLEHQFRDQYPGKSVLRLPNGVDPASFSAGPARHTPRLIFFGALGRPELLQTVLEALPATISAVGPSAVELHVLGDGQARPQLEALVQKLSLPSNVTFHGWTKIDDLTKHVATGDIGLCLMPAGRTTAACSNQKVFQYMACQLCVVASAVGDLPIYLEHGQAGKLVPAGDAAALAETLAKLLHNRDLRLELARRGQELASTTYAWATLASQTEQLLMEVVK